MGSFTTGNKISFEYNGKHRVGTIVETKSTYIRLDTGISVNGNSVKTFTKEKIEGKIRVIN